jgi:hypothetical protein
MPEMLAAFAPMLFEAGAEAAPGALSAAAPEALAAGAEAAAPALGSAAGLGAAGLPFAAGAGELGSVATGLGPAGVSAFGDTAGLASVLGSTGLGAGSGEIGSTVASGINTGISGAGFGTPATGLTSALSGLSGAPSGLADAILPANASLTSATGPSAFNPALGAGASIDPAAASGASGSAFDTAAPVSNWTGDVAPTPAAPSAAGGLPAPDGGINGWLKDNAGLLSLGIGGAGLGLSVLAPQLSRAVSPQLPNQPQLTANAQSAQKQADALQGQEATLIAPLTTGVLPEAQQINLDSVTNDAINSVRSKYASMGLSGSTMELEAINNVKNNAAATKVSIENSLAATGLQMGNQALTAMGLTDGIYTQLMNATLSQDQSLQQAIAKMAGAAAQGSALGTAINSGKSTSTPTTAAA